MNKDEILLTIKEKMENCEGGAYGFIDWIEDFVDKQLNDDEDGE